MPFLAIETSSEYLSFAIDTPSGIVARDWLVGQKQSEVTLPYLQTFLDEHGLTMNDIQGIAYPSGPGSFTGLRIGCGIAQGLAFAKNIPLLGISTLAAIAEASKAIRVVSCIDARMNQVYYACFEKIAGEWQTTIPAQVCNPEDVPPPLGTGWFAAGNGFSSYATALEARIGPQISEIDSTLYPHAAQLLSLALPQFAAGLGQPAHAAELVYLRDKVALKTHERMQK
ncbi:MULTISPECIES: tRNA (adenosine(37)-N6)-threonylcarbamoyltransferase complex dimerization subunit type 1 TsaB [Deefgea]|uniref:tRNA (Adenosine(37)-N6)-threonylcarbamoyltransferase complex dimerization subunit type 1 TsaB n=1 Tax=Deefgea chitinilytica TaxID=570276 RepID=A0ABS2CAK7_9NEIS|nr:MULTISPECIES: tRNA (adenosine(37)-N6)-threonylcarbamoyltransferase complex dimerization subunit type 1 TsaB [Deefgea]MBM5571057.1 tRNA (adenosine(37)-N6)-threonylcarbamoyltransferase complex dimerization subunit type 1 TsaB [Deefgea chitinilytica]MBM9888287.1 tRNA (adenosine(37)-N6)-threonylcarbamoyltransferase complex dimerization subunit type 1 TsaB [Deefgea sp. CFH1-16]